MLLCTFAGRRQGSAWAEWYNLVDDELACFLFVQSDLSSRILISHPRRDEPAHHDLAHRVVCETRRADEGACWEAFARGDGNVNEDEGLRIAKWHK